MKRPAQPEEIAPAYVFFASDADITGEILTLLGGETTTGYETPYLFAGIARMAPSLPLPHRPSVRIREGHRVVARNLLSYRDTARHLTGSIPAAIIEHTFC
jgi:hypothetical protein